MKSKTLLISTLLFITIQQSATYAGSKSPGVAPVNDPQYLEECGSCHFAYQPGLLPERSWNKLMDGLESHFGENAELPADELKSLRAYLIENAADHANYKRSKKIIRSLRSNDVPLRATETSYLIRKHDDLSVAMVAGNPKVGSISNCQSCHTKAGTGSYSESGIVIPGYGRWED